MSLAGLWQITVMFQDSPVSGSPFDVNVYDPSLAKIIGNASSAETMVSYSFEGISGTADYQYFQALPVHTCGFVKHFSITMYYNKQWTVVKLAAVM